VKRTVALAIVSLVLGAAGVLYVGRGTALEPATYLPSHARPGSLAFAAACVAVMWLLPAWRLRLLADHHGTSLSWRAAILAHWMMVFGAALTPSGTGGAPTLVAALTRSGLRFGTAVGMAVQLFVLDIVAFAWLVPPALLHLATTRSAVLPGGLIAVAVPATIIAIVGAAWLVRYPRPAVWLMLYLARRPWLSKRRAQLRAQARVYYRSAKAFAGLRRSRWIGLTSISIGGWVGNFALFWSLLAIYGTDLPIVDVLAVLSVVTIVSFAIPTPGAAGFMEVAAGLTASTAGADAVAPALVLWRTGSFYASFALGPIATWMILRHRPGRNGRDASRPPRSLD
jgi:uncharacterized protein (TIRG00374 family)